MHCSTFRNLFQLVQGTPTFLLLVLCAHVSAVAQEPDPVSGVYMLKNSKWPSRVDGKTVIPVSWENPDEDNRQERKWVEEAIAGTWEKFANIDFVGWQKCTPDADGIRIAIDPNGWPHTKGLGTRLNAKTAGMVLNFTFSGQFKCAGHSREDCIKFVAVHEFGHALGLAHEHNRRDCLCSEEPQGGDGDFYLTPCDLESVMNYCNPRWNNYGRLSNYDIIGVQVIYGKPQMLTPTFDLDEIRLVPCSESVTQKIATIKNVIIKGSQIRIRSFSQEANPIPSNAVDNLPNLITVRYFDPKDEAKAFGLKTLLGAQGFDLASVDVEDMTARMGRIISKYIEVWAREPENIKGAVLLDEIRLVPATSVAIEKVNRIKEQITSSQFSVKTFTQEENEVPQNAINNMPNAITIRYFHHDDESKAFELQNLLANSFDEKLITVESMIPRMTKLYPNYVEIWSK